MINLKQENNKLQPYDQDIPYVNQKSFGLSYLDMFFVSYVFVCMCVRVCVHVCSLTTVCQLVQVCLRPRNLATKTSDRISTKVHLLYQNL